MAGDKSEYARSKSVSLALCVANKENLQFKRIFKLHFQVLCTYVQLLASKYAWKNIDVFKVMLNVVLARKIDLL